MGLGGNPKPHAHASNLVSADSASFPFGRRDEARGVFNPPSDVVTVVAVVDGRMRVVDVPRGARLSDVDLASLGGPGDARAAEFSSVVSVAVNREPVPPGAEVAVTLRVGDLVEVTRARLAAADGGSPGAELSRRDGHRQQRGLREGVLPLMTVVLLYHTYRVPTSTIRERDGEKKRVFLMW